MIRASVYEETEDKIYHFYSGLHTKIQDIIDYNEYNTDNHLFQLAMLAKKELQGCQLIKMKTSFTPRSTSTTPSRIAMPSGARYLDDEFSFTTSFHVIDTFYNNVSCYGPE
jgi:hypothetical protein